MLFRFLCWARNLNVLGMHECEQEARSYHNDQYWINRARVRLDSVDWTQGAARLTMDLVKDAMHDIKKERAGEQKPTYVPPQQWGERAHGT